MILGITGGVGSGKSTVLNYLKEKYDAFVIEADLVAKRIMEPGHNVYDQVVSAFSEIKLSENGFIDRAHLAAIVFQDVQKLKQLNAIVHPGVKEEIQKMIQTSAKENEKRMIVIEAALLIEDGYKQICDEIWYIYCEKEERIRRLIGSRGYTREKALEIMNRQMSEKFFRENTDAFVDNTKDTKYTQMQIDKLVCEFRKR